MFYIMGWKLGLNVLHNGMEIKQVSACISKIKFDIAHSIYRHTISLQDAVHFGLHILGNSFKLKHDGASAYTIFLQP